MSLNFKLRRDAHAIGEFSATLAFPRPVSARAFAEVNNRLKEASLAFNLPAPMNVQVFNIPIGIPSGPPPPGGVGFQRFASNGEIACSLFCDLDGITLTLRDYDRWQNVLPKVQQAFASITPAYMAEVPAIRAFQVQYLNEFTSKSLDNNVTAEIFRPNGQWISPFSYSSEQPWHCHVGQFILADERSRHLININCDVAPLPYPPIPETRTYVKVLIFVSRQYDLPTRGPLVVDVDKLPAAMEENFTSVHSLEKKLLGEIISDKYLDEMGEGARDY